MWLPEIPAQTKRFIQGPAMRPKQAVAKGWSDSANAYWTPALADTDSRRAVSYGPQALAWVDVDEGDLRGLRRLKPSFWWETSPGKAQAVWLLEEPLEPQEYSRHGLLGALASSIGADASGVDVSQVLRIPGSTHRKTETPFVGSVHGDGHVVSKRALLKRLCAVAGVPARTARRVCAPEPIGDRSKEAWLALTELAEAGVEQNTATALLSTSVWNKWGDAARVHEQTLRAYAKVEAEKAAQTLVVADAAGDAEPEVPERTWAGLEALAEAAACPQRWLLPGVIPEAGCGVIVAPPKTGKSRVTLEIATGLATGVAPLGVPVHKAVPVLVYSLEDGLGLVAERVGKALTKEGRTKHYWHGYGEIVDGAIVMRLPEPTLLSVSTEPLDLSTEAGLEDLRNSVKETGARLVVIDTLSMAVGAASINNSSEMYAVLKEIKKVAVANGCAMLLVHHTRKRLFEKGESVQESILGSTAIHAWCDYVLSVREHEEEEHLELSVQTKRGGAKHTLSSALDIVAAPDLSLWTE